MHWLQRQDDGSIDLSSLQLDIVGFLAILGEGSVLANAQVSTLSKWVFLPRLMPAPQALMRPSRPQVLEPVRGNVSGIFSGNHREDINHVGNIVCDASNLPPFSVRVVEIKRTGNNELKSKTKSPLTVVTILGFIFSSILFGLSIWLDDGMSLMATILLSLLSSIIGYGNKWQLQLPKRAIKNGKVPRGDVVIRYLKGSFLVVKCDEDVAREMYFAPEEIKYLLDHGSAYRLLSLIGTAIFMGGVICLANSRIELQIAWAGSYMLLGSSYWIVAALPEKFHWDTSCYTVTSECLSDSNMQKKGYPSENQTFTQALWKAIVVSKSTKWVLTSDACPHTPAWKNWLRDAEIYSKSVGVAEKENMHGVKTWAIPEWDPQSHLVNLLAEQAQHDDDKMAGVVEEV
ncbi:hypothetical protein P153DRAFT_345948 [Dothidotthia symphoricarpi CBS 119687]|uniref:Uncharacterized protein n=1 Tax=Dothidotthia symphoricarpi CBS 119687 TaxID=1392245 RepID=A0A6A6A470_9PLEO|nr:uncharacterized protein P153DRAFT_345948 [Dothidotthia symphoricarpi CBS 119687]KAF2126346.1 hypothetical protein P153DRAFT_345948 [Dothidotthia symphoricarpi CBS 119687]